MLLARQQRADRICTPGAGSRGVFEGGVYKGSEAPSSRESSVVAISKTGRKPRSPRQIKCLQRTGEYFSRFSGSTSEAFNFQAAPDRT